MSKQKTKVLLVEDSLTVLTVLRNFLEKDDSIEIVGEATNGRKALSLLENIKPDIIITDIEMPVMDGLTFIEEVMSENPLPIIVFTSAPDNYTDLNFKALELGALEFIEKPALFKAKTDNDFQKNFIKKIKFFSTINVVKRHNKASRKKRKSLNSLTSDFKPDNAPTLKKIRKNKIKVIGMVSSTGGPKTLKRLLTQLPGNFPACIIIVQHIAKGFLTEFVAWLKKNVNLNVELAKKGMKVKENTILIAPDGYHTVVREGGIIAFDDSEPIYGIKPAGDLLLRSIGEVYGNRSCGVILTGMGEDGSKGIEVIKRNGGLTIAQDESTSIIFGMPKAAITRNVIDYVLALDEIPPFFIKLFEIK